MDTFLRKYLDQNVLDQLPEKTVENLDKLEKNLDTQLQSGNSFQDVMKEYGPHIADLISRISNEVKQFKPSFTGVWDSLKFVIDISKEVYQIVENVQAKIVPVGTTAEEAEVIKINFGVETVYFIWATVDPLKNKLSWLPFRQSLEKWIVTKLAKIGLQHAVSFFKANPKFSPFSDNLTIVKSL